MPQNTNTATPAISPWAYTAPSEPNSQRFPVSWGPHESGSEFHPDDLPDPFAPNITEPVATLDYITADGQPLQFAGPFASITALREAFACRFLLARIAATNLASLYLGIICTHEEVRQAEQAQRQPITPPENSALGFYITWRRRGVGGTTRGADTRFDVRGPASEKDAFYQAWQDWEDAQGLGISGEQFNNLFIRHCPNTYPVDPTIVLPRSDGPAPDLGTMREYITREGHRVVMVGPVTQINNIWSSITQYERSVGNYETLLDLERTIRERSTTVRYTIEKKVIVDKGTDIEWTRYLANGLQERVCGPKSEKQNYEAEINDYIRTNYSSNGIQYTGNLPVPFDEIFDMTCRSTARPVFNPNDRYLWFSWLSGDRPIILDGPFRDYTTFLRKYRETRLDFGPIGAHVYIWGRHAVAALLPDTEYAPANIPVPSIIERYNYKCDPIFFPEHLPNTLYYGMELEMDAGAKRKGVIYHDKSIETAGIKNAPDLYFKQDGSLEHGFEVVTRPATWEYLRDRDFSFTKKFREMGYQSYNTKTCGHHIHVSREGLTTDTVANLLIFIQGNKEFVVRASRRNMPNLQRWARFTDMSTADLKAMVKDKRLQYEKYFALNLLPEHTIEFRFFRGTISEEAIKRNLAFVVALVHWAKVANEDKLTVDVWLEWLLEFGDTTLGAASAKDLYKWVSKLQTAIVEGDNE